VQRVCDPDGYGESDGQVDEIALDDHVRSFQTEVRGRSHAIARKDRVLLRARSGVRM
jgi:hypothetical protein